MLVSLVNSCHKRYSETICFTCSYQEHCPRDCARCLHYIHSPQHAPMPRKYDCGKMMDCYVCKYAYKYVSELHYAFRVCNKLSKKRNLNVLSIGCGPCTDLLALDLLRSNGEYAFDTLSYKGIELDTSIWDEIYQDLFDMVPDEYSVEIIEANACRYIDTLIESDWSPDLIVFQYVFSDMCKHSEESEIYYLIDSMGAYIKNCCVGTYIVCNDINLAVSMGGGRDYFDDLQEGMKEHTDFRKYHFNNSNKQNHYEYGVEYKNNSLILQIPQYLHTYEPFDSCASAQMLILKVK